MTIFALETSRKDQSLILKRYKIEEKELRFFPTNTSVFELLQLNPDIIIQDYNKGHIIECKGL